MFLLIFSRVASYGGIRKRVSLKHDSRGGHDLLFADQKEAKN